jgi:hypothetical protein
MALQVICLQNMSLVFVSLHNMSNMKENLIFPPWTPLWLLLCLVKFWGCRHLLWGLVKAIPCPSDVTKPWKIQSMLVWHQSWLKKHNPFCKIPSQGPKRVVRDDKSGKRHVQMWGCLHASSRLLWRLDLLQACHCPLLWKAIIIDVSRSCIKFTSLGNCLNCLWYFKAHGPTMCVEPKSKLQVIF